MIDGAERSGADAVVEFLEHNTASHVFGLSGSSSVPVFHRLATSDLTFMPAVQENAAVAMADGYSRFKGLTGLLLYMLPGVATGLSNIYNAFRDESPLLLIASQLASASRRGMSAVGEADVASLAAPFTRRAHEVRTRSQLVEAMRTAASFAHGPPSGPSAIVVPEDLWVLRAEDDVACAAKATDPSMASYDLEPIVDRLRTAEQPLIVVGGQLRRMGGSHLVEALAERLAIPVMYEPFWNDRLGIAPGHSSCLGQLSERSGTATSADFVLLLGCRFFNEIRPRTDRWFPNGFVAHVNADPSKIADARAAAWSAAASPARVLESLLDEVEPVGPVDTLLARRQQRLDDARARRRTRRTTGFSGVAEVLSREMDHSVLVDEGSTANAAVVAALNSTHGERYVSTTGGSLGWGSGAAAGVALGSELPVTCVLGDGAFFFGLQGLIPAASLELPVTYVIIDNHGFASTQYFEREYVRMLEPDEDATVHALGSDFRGIRPKVLEVAGSFGFETHDAATPADLEEQLRVETSGPRVIRIELDPTW